MRLWGHLRELSRLQTCKAIQANIFNLFDASKKRWRGNRCGRNHSHYLLIVCFLSIFHHETMSKNEARLRSSGRNYEDNREHLSFFSWKPLFELFPFVINFERFLLKSKFHLKRKSLIKKSLSKDPLILLKKLI